MFIELDDFDHCIEKKEELITQRTDAQATCFCDKKIEIIEVGYL